jgi:hypothetical protein
MSVFGWLTLKEAERYTRAAERKRLAERSMGSFRSKGAREVSNLACNPIGIKGKFLSVAPRRATIFTSHDYVVD